LVAIEIARAQRGGAIRIRGCDGKALRQWLESHELPAIIAAVLGVVVALSVLMVAVGYLVAKP